MSDIRGKRNWLLGITQGRWQVLEGEKLNLTAVEMVEVVPESDLQEALDVIAAQLEPLDWVADIDESGLSQEDAERIAKDILTAFGALLARHGRHKA